MKSRRILQLFMALVLSLSLVACQNGGDAGKKEGGDSKDAYKIGLHYELTGAVADYGTTENKASKLAIKLANDKAGYEKFKGLEFDNKSDGTEAVSVANTIANEKVVGVVGPATSGDSAATYQIMDAAGIVVVSPSATQNNITLKNPDDPKSEVYEHVYRVCFEDSYQGAAAAQFSVDSLQGKKTVIYADSSSDYSKGLMQAYKEQFVKLGGEVVAEEFYTAGDTDFSSVLTSIKDKDFDTLFISGYYNEAGLIIKQAKEMGIEANVLGGDGFDSETLVQLAGKENLNNVYFTTAYTTVGASPELQAFIDAFKKEYNEEPSMFSALAFDSTNLLIQAIEEAGSPDSKAINEKVAAMNFKGITGEFKFDEKHTPLKNVLVVELKDGVQSEVTSVSPK